MDLRTFITLETRLLQKLLKDWQRRSGPFYDKIAEHCRLREWDKARVLVGELDLTETGNTHREWIKYLLLSCAIFGAKQVAKDKPSFVGVGSFDIMLNQVTSNFVRYLQQDATRQIQAQAMQLIAEDEQKSKALKWDESKHPRDAKGRFTDSLSVEVSHGTAPQNLESILSEGIRVERAGEVWPAFSSRERVYVTTDEDEAIRWAHSASAHKAGNAVSGGTMFPIAILKVRIPSDQVHRLVQDHNFRYDDTQRQFTGSIPPEWIIGAKVGIPTDAEWLADYKWKNVRLPKVAQDDTVIYVVLVLADIVTKFNPYHDKDGKFTTKDKAIPPSGILDTLQQPDGGFTYHTSTGRQPTTGYAVSLYKDREKVLDLQQVTVAGLAKFTKDNRDLLRQPNNYLGAWHNPENGKVYLDISTIVDSPLEAARLGRAANQIAYFDLSRGQSVTIGVEDEKKVAAETRALRGGFRDRHPFVGGIDRALPSVDGQGAYGVGDRGSETYTRILKGGVGFKYDPNQPRDEIGRWTETGLAPTRKPETVKDAETTIRALTGIKDVYVSDHPHALAATPVVADTIRELRDKGYTLPEEVQILMIDGPEPAGMTTWLSPREDAPIGQRKPRAVLDIRLPAKAPVDMPLDTMVAKAFGGTVKENGAIDRFTVRTMRDIVIHEMGHVQTGYLNTFAPAQQVGSPFYFEPGNLRTSEAIRDAAYRVSDYAYHDANEFLAESFVRLYRGETLSPDSMKLYTTLKGPAIR